MRRTKIVCTIGPKTLNKDSLHELRKNGLSVARLNGSHANLEWHENAIKLIRETIPDVPILLDIPGRKIRTAHLMKEPSFIAGNIIILTTDPNYVGIDKVLVNYENLHLDVDIDNTIMADDGTLAFTVTKIDDRDIYCRAECSGVLGSRKGINVPFINLNTPQVTNRDKDMVEFACGLGIDYIGLSFVESAKHIIAFQDLIGNRSLRIVAKVENQGGIDNLDEICRVADAIMIDRGDLSVETSLHDVAIKQKSIIRCAKQYAKPVIVATEMLHTMIQNSFPTKAEVADITNAVLDGCSATMLSGETAVGEFPLESVITMAKVIDAAEKYLVYEGVSKWNSEVLKSVPEAMSMVIPNLCRSLPITKIVAITRSGYAARMIAMHQLPQPILAVSDDLAAAHSFGLIPGTTGIFSDSPFSTESGDHILQNLKSLYNKSLLTAEDLVLVSGITYPAPKSRMNTIQIFDMKSMANKYHWLC
jgi:pyruvate kinase